MRRRLHGRVDASMLESMGMCVLCVHVCVCVVCMYPSRNPSRGRGVADRVLRCVACGSRHRKGGGAAPLVCSARASRRHPRSLPAARRWSGAAGGGGRVLSRGERAEAQCRGESWVPVCAWCEMRGVDNGVRENDADSTGWSGESWNRGTWRARMRGSDAMEAVTMETNCGRVSPCAERMRGPRACGVGPRWRMQGQMFSRGEWPASGALPLEEEGEHESEERGCAQCGRRMRGGVRRA